MKKAHYMSREVSPLMLFKLLTIFLAEATRKEYQKLLILEKNNTPLKHRDCFFKFFANCILVKGVLRSTICDLQRNNIDVIPNEIFEILTQHKDSRIGDIMNLFDQEDAATIYEYFEFLIEKDYLFLSKKKAELDLFPDIDVHWESPSIIDNAIIELDEQAAINLPDIFEQLSDLGCEALELRSYCTQSIADMRAILAALNGSRIESVFFIVPFSAELNAEQVQLLFAEYPRLLELTIHSTPESSMSNNQLFEGQSYNAKWLKQKIDSSHHCGFIAPQNFSINIDFYLEAKLFNSCLNKKIAVDADGNIKNCPSMKESYGKIQDTQLLDVISQPGFQDLWNIKKDDISICKVCEFRYVCSDCRAFTVDGTHSKPAKCSYDPYTGNWAE